MDLPGSDERGVRRAADEFAAAEAGRGGRQGRDSRSPAAPSALDAMLAGRSGAPGVRDVLEALKPREAQLLLLRARAVWRTGNWRGRWGSRRLRLARCWRGRKRNLSVSSAHVTENTYDGMLAGRRTTGLPGSRTGPPGDMQRVAAHLGECAKCDGLCTELAARAAHVAALMELLPEWSEAAVRPAGRPAVVPVRRMPRPSWIGIAVAVAAGLALAVYLKQDRPVPRAQVRPTVQVPEIASPAVAIAAEEVSAVVAAPAAPRRTRRVRETTPDPAYFVALDDEPFESGVIMRVDVKPGNLQADIVFGPDGRAHAFRLVNASQRNY